MTGIMARLVPSIRPNACQSVLFNSTLINRKNFCTSFPFQCNRGLLQCSPESVKQKGVLSNAQFHIFINPLHKSLPKNITSQSTDLLAFWSFRRLLHNKAVSDLIGHYNGKLNLISNWLTIVKGQSLHDTIVRNYAKCGAKKPDPCSKKKRKKPKCKPAKKSPKKKRKGCPPAKENKEKEQSSDCGKPIPCIKQKKKKPPCNIDDIGKADKCEVKEEPKCEDEKPKKKPKKPKSSKKKKVVCKKPKACVKQKLTKDPCEKGGKDSSKKGSGKKGPKGGANKKGGKKDVCAKKDSGKGEKPSAKPPSPPPPPSSSSPAAKKGGNNPPKVCGPAAAINSKPDLTCKRANSGKPNDPTKPAASPKKKFWQFWILGF